MRQREGKPLALGSIGTIASTTMKYNYRLQFAFSILLAC